jgi:hypothetical protein
MRAPSEHTKCVVRHIPKSYVAHSSLVCAEGLDIGDHASADTSRHRNSLLQQMDEQVSAPLVLAWMTP